MNEPKQETILRTVTIYESDYNILTLIAKREKLLTANGKLSIRQAVRYLINKTGGTLA